MAAIQSPLTLFLVLFAQKSCTVRKCQNTHGEPSPSSDHMGRDMEACRLGLYLGNTTGLSTNTNDPHSPYSVVA